MQMIALPPEPDKQPVNLKMDRRLSTLLNVYADRVASTVEHLVNEAILAIIAGQRLTLSGPVNSDLGSRPSSNKSEPTSLGPSLEPTIASLAAVIVDLLVERWE